MNLGLSLQTLGRITDFRNPNSNDADGGLDFFLRRGLMRLGGNFTDYVRFFLQAEASAATENDPGARDGWPIHRKLRFVGTGKVLIF